MQEIPDFFLEQLLLDELSQERKEELREDPRIAPRLRKLEESNRQILEKYDFGEFARRLPQEEISAEPEVFPFAQNQDPSKKTRRLRLLTVTAPVLAAAAALVVRHTGSADKTALSGIDITLHA